MAKNKLVTEPEKQVNNKYDGGRNKEGSGGFKDNPDSINKKGRPKKGYSITEAFKKMFKSDAEKRKKLINAIWASALSGDTTAQKMIWSYMDGMPKQNIKMENESTKEIKDTIKKLQESDEIIRNLCQPTTSVGETETQ